MMIPQLVPIAGSPWSLLPKGRHLASLEEVAARFALNAWRRTMFDGLVRASRSLKEAGCLRLFLDGSYVTGKPRPGDYDACWDPAGVDPTCLDPVFLDFDNQRAAQKAKYYGEFFPSSWTADIVGTAFIEFFQVDRFTGTRKGIVQIDLSSDSMLDSREIV